MDVNDIPQLTRRRIEAQVLAQLFAAMEPELGREQALKLVAKAVREDAAKAGREFAALCPGKPSLAHFATVVERWKQGGALDVCGAALTGDRLELTVTRCGYAEAYAQMGLNPDLIPLLSCARDESFARGYSPHLTLNRPRTIAQGAPHCAFAFTWRA